MAEFTSLLLGSDGLPMCERFTGKNKYILEILTLRDTDKVQPETQPGGHNERDEAQPVMSITTRNLHRELELLREGRSSPHVSV